MNALKWLWQHKRISIGGIAIVLIFIAGTCLGRRCGPSPPGSASSGVTGSGVSIPWVSPPALPPVKPVIFSGAKGATKVVQKAAGVKHLPTLPKDTTSVLIVAPAPTSPAGGASDRDREPVVIAITPRGPVIQARDADRVTTIQVQKPWFGFEASPGLGLRVNAEDGKAKLRPAGVLSLARWGRDSRVRAPVLSISTDGSLRLGVSLRAFRELHIGAEIDRHAQVAAVAWLRF